MAATRAQSVHSRSIRSARPIARWIVPGRTLMVKHRMLNIAKDCTVVFSPDRWTAELQGDAIESVEFWFRYPIVSGRLYIPDPATALLRPALPEEGMQINPSHRQWLIRFTGKTAQAVRRLFNNL